MHTHPLPGPRMGYRKLDLNPLVIYPVNSQ